jgi:hypothetical protein
MEILIDTFCHFPRIVQMLVVLFFQFFVMFAIGAYFSILWEGPRFVSLLHPCPGFSASAP